MKAFAIVLVLLGASLAHASDDLDASTLMTQTQYMKSLNAQLENDKALLATASDDDSRDVIKADMDDVQDQLQDISAID